MKMKIFKFLCKIGRAYKIWSQKFQSFLIMKKKLNKINNKKIQNKNFLIMKIYF